MKRLLVCLSVLLSACAAQEDAAPVMDTDLFMEEMALPCGPDEVAVQDGIGGTGCKVP